MPNDPWEIAAVGDDDPWGVASVDDETGVKLADPGRRAPGQSFSYENDTKPMTRQGDRMAPTYAASATVTASPINEPITRAEIPKEFRADPAVEAIVTSPRNRLLTAQRASGKPLGGNVDPWGIQKIAGTDQEKPGVVERTLAATPRPAVSAVEAVSAPFEKFMGSAAKVLSPVRLASTPSAEETPKLSDLLKLNPGVSILDAVTGGSFSKTVDEAGVGREANAALELGAGIVNAGASVPRGILTPSENESSAEAAAWSVPRTAAHVVDTLTQDPTNIAMAGMSLPRNALGLATDALFAANMAPELNKGVEELGDAIGSGDAKRFWQTLPAVAAPALMGGMMVKHGAGKASDLYYGSRMDSLASRSESLYNEVLGTAQEKAKANLDAGRSAYDGMTANEVAALSRDRKLADMRAAQAGEGVRDDSLRRGADNDELVAIAKAMYSDRPDVNVQIHEDASTLPQGERTQRVEGDVNAFLDKGTNTVHVIRPQIEDAVHAVEVLTHEREHTTADLPAHKVADMAERQFKQELYKLTEEGALSADEFNRLSALSGRDLVREVRKANTGPDSAVQIAADEVLAVMRESAPVMAEPSKLDVLMGKAAKAIPGVTMTPMDATAVTADQARAARGEFTPDRPVQTVGRAPDFPQPGGVYAEDAQVGPQFVEPQKPIGVGDRVSAVGAKGKALEGVLEKVSKSGKTAMLKLDDGSSVRVDMEKVTRPEARPIEAAPVATEAPVAPEAQQPAIEATPIAELPGLDRRSHAEIQRQFEGRRWADLTDAERIARGYQNELSGLPGKRYWDDAIDTPEGRAQRPDAFFYDLDDFKLLNHRLSHEGVDKVALPFIGDAFKEVLSRPEFKDAVSVAHRSGDEFTGRSPSKEISDAFVKAMNERLRDATFVFVHDGKTYYHKGLGGSHGTGPDIVAAEAASKQNKAERRASGERVGYRDSELGLPPAGSEAGGDQGGREGVPADAGARAEVAPFPEAETALPASDGLRLSRAQTKTPEFKKFFGDWENDPANASKVVDENGTPRIVYHGTLADEFSSFRSGSGTPDRMLGPHFSETPATADAFTIGAYARDHNAPWGWVDEATVTRGPKSEYNEKGAIVRPGGKTYAAYLDIRNPLDLTGGKEWFDQAQIARSVAMHAARTNPELFVPLFDRFARDGRVRVSNRDRTLSFNELLSDAPALERFVQSNGGALFAEAKPMVDWFKATSGYDGIKYTNSSPNEGEGSIAWVAFHPDRQVKSALGNTGAFGSRPPTEAEASGLGMTVPEAVAAQKAGDIRLSRRQETTPEFKRWFGDWEDPKAFSSRRDPKKEPVSYAVDADGRPMVLYHGTRGNFGTFSTRTKGFTSSFLGSEEVDRHAAFFAERPADAEAYVESGGNSTGANIRPVYINAKAPLDLTRSGEWFDDVLVELEREGVNPRWVMGINHTWELFDGEGGKKFVDALGRIGYDSVTFDDINPVTGDSFRAWAVFSPTQIKSATGNVGTFDATNPDIRMSRSRPNDKLLRPILGDLVELSAQMMADKRNGIGDADDLFAALSDGVGATLAERIKKASPYLYEQAKADAAQRENLGVTIKQAVEQRLAPKGTQSRPTEANAKVVADATDYVNEALGLKVQKGNAAAVKKGLDLYATAGYEGVSQLIHEAAGRSGVIFGQELPPDLVVAAKMALADPEVNAAAEKDPKVLVKHAALWKAWRTIGSLQSESFRLRNFQNAMPDPERVKTRIRELFIAPNAVGKNAFTEKDAAKQIAKLKKVLKKEFGVENVDHIPLSELMDRDRMSRFANEVSALNANAGMKLRTYLINNLVSQVSTNTANIGGNTLNMGVEYALHRRVEARINQMFGLDGVMPSDIKGLAGLLAKAHEQALKDASSYWKTGYNPTYEAVHGADWIDQLGSQKRSFGGKYTKHIEDPTRALGAEDAYFVSLMGHMEAMSAARGVARQKMVEAAAKDISERTGVSLNDAKKKVDVKKILSSAEYNDSVARLFDNKQSEAWERGMNRAYYLTFKDEANKFLKTMLMIRNRHPNFVWIQTFLTMPINGMLRGSEFVPGVGLITHGAFKDIGDIRAKRTTGEQLATKYSRLAAAQAIGMIGALALARTGATQYGDDGEEPWITGSELPRGMDTSEAEAQRRSVEPYTVKVPFADARWSYRRYEPIATGLGLTVDMVSAFEDFARRRNMERFFKKAKHAVYGQLMEKPFMAGVGNIVEQLQGSPSAQNPLISFPSMLAPKVLSQFPRAFDPFVREARPYGADATQEGYPQSERFLRSFVHSTTGIPWDIEPRVNLMGDEVRKSGNPIQRLITGDELRTSSRGSKEQRMLDRKFLALSQNMGEDTPDLPREMRPEMKLGPRSFKMMPRDWHDAEVEAGAFLKQAARDSGILEGPMTPEKLEALREMSRYARDGARGKLAPKYWALPPK